MRRAPAIAALLLLAAALVGCDHTGTHDNASVDPRHAADAARLGSGTSVGDGLDDPLRDAWPRLLYVDAFPPATVFVNAAEYGDTAVAARADQVPIARAIEPDTLVIWLDTNDAVAAVPVAEFSNALAGLIRDVGTAGAQRVLVGELPADEGIPAGTTAAYNAAIRDAARANGAIVVHWPANPCGRTTPSSMSSTAPQTNGRSRTRSRAP